MLIRRLTAQTCRQRGLSSVYAELLDFAGDEIYFTEQPALIGSTYADALMRFADASVFGIVRGTVIMLNRPPTPWWPRATSWWCWRPTTPRSGWGSRAR